MQNLLIGVVGPCASGKTTLVASMDRAGYRVRHIAQEHSYVPDMWARITHPDLLVYLHVSYPLTIERRRMDWTIKEYEEQLFRLRHARQLADLTIDTDHLTPQEVFEKVIDFVGKNDEPATKLDNP
jgi:deoxyadenosine/deoxycytidine kinase